MSANLVIAGRQNGFTNKERATIVRATVASYRNGMHDFAAIRNLDVWYTKARDLRQPERAGPPGIAGCGENRASHRGRDDGVVTPSHRSWR